MKQRFHFFPSAIALSITPKQDRAQMKCVIGRNDRTKSGRNELTRLQLCTTSKLNSGFLSLVVASSNLIV
jgi:hypothetical protein